MDVPLGKRILDTLELASASTLARGDLERGWVAPREHRCCVLDIMSASGLARGDLELGRGEPRQGRNCVLPCPWDNVEGGQPLGEGLAHEGGAGDAGRGGGAGEASSRGDACSGGGAGDAGRGGGAGEAGWGRGAGDVPARSFQAAEAGDICLAKSTWLSRVDCSNALLLAGNECAQSLDAFELWPLILLAIKVLELTKSSCSTVIVGGWASGTVGSSSSGGRGVTLEASDEMGWIFAPYGTSLLKGRRYRWHSA